MTGVAVALSSSSHLAVFRGALPRLLAASMALSAGSCGTIKRTVLGAPATGPQIQTGFIGGVVADEPRAALTAKEVLAVGGNAADAAATLGMMLSVTLPSRAGLAGGGACLVYQPGADSPNKGQPEAILFPASAPATLAGDRPAAVPMLARGLYLLSARYGTRSFAQAVAPAEAAARFGFPISRALGNDLALVGRPLVADSEAAAIFAPNGTVLGEGATLTQVQLASLLTQLRTVGVGDFYTGLVAHKFAEASGQAGGAVGVNDLRNARATLAAPLTGSAGNDQLAWLPMDGGSAAQAAFAALGQGAASAQAAADAAAAQARGKSLDLLPASTSFTVVDGQGGAVACALSMNNLFGTGRVAPGTGLVLAASPAAKPAPLLEAGLAWNANLHALRAAIAASGQRGAPLAAAQAMAAALGSSNEPVAEPGRANLVACSGYLPGSPESCHFMADPRNAGLAATGG